jgi:hypothetical protein
MKESPIFTRTYDLLCWLIPLTVKFPRNQRFVVAARLQQRALDFQEQIIEAAKVSDSRTALERADVTLAQLRSHFRLSKDLNLISIGQFEHGVRMMSEIGRLLGGWMSSISK